LNFWDVWNYIS